MASSGNFCTWTDYLGIDDDGHLEITYSEGNTTATQTHNGISTTGTHAVSSGKWYWEIYYSASSDFSDGHLLAGWQSLKNNIDYAYTRQQPGGGAGAPDRYTWGSHLMNYKGAGTAAYQGGYLSSYNDVNNDTYNGAYNLGLRVSSAKVLQFAGDFDNHKLYFGIENTWYSLANSGTGGSAANTDNGSFNTSYGWSIESTWQGHHWTPACWFSGAASGTVATINAGQDSTFSGRLSAGGNADGNGFGDFKYAPPTGFLALCSANLPIDDDVDPAQTDDDYIGGKQFNAITYTGNRTGGSTTNNITGVGFQPDLVWLKIRTQTYDHRLIDSSRGAGQQLRSNKTNAESTEATGLTSFDSDGFTVSGDNNYNSNGDTFAAWCWRANGGTTASNSNGAISSTVQANQAAGFSIVQWTANATSSVATTVGHGLSKAPEFVITKSRDSAGNWCVTHTGLSSTSHMLFLNSNAAETDKSGNGSMSANTSTVFSVNATDGSNAPNGDNMIAYCWHSVDGYSKFGKYEGNGNSSGPFIYMGFRPRMVVIRAIDSNQMWAVCDTARETFNPLGEKILQWNDSGAEFDASGFNFDIVSNGIKIRSSDTNINSSATFIYMAWGDVPFKYNNTF